MFFLIVSLDISLPCFLPLPLVTLCPTLNNSLSLPVLILSIHVSEKEGVTSTEITRKLVFSLDCRTICTSDPGMMLQLWEWRERGGCLLPRWLCLTWCNATQVDRLKGSWELHRSEQSSLADSWTWQKRAAPFHWRLPRVMVPWCKANNCCSAWGKSACSGVAGGWWSQRWVREQLHYKSQVTVLSIILWIKSEHRGVKWHQGLLSWRIILHHLLSIPCSFQVLKTHGNTTTGNWSLLVLTLSEHMAYSSV